jgi:isopentenyl diphosphate isomerase/L-lactate dehydrogenase-like FMN-dependent dehydrogenase
MIVLTEETETAMRLLGVSSIAELSARHVCQL